MNWWDEAKSVAARYARFREEPIERLSDEQRRELANREYHRARTQRWRRKHRKQAESFPLTTPASQREKGANAVNL